MYLKFQSQTPEEPLRSLSKAGALNSGGVNKKKKTKNKIQMSRAKRVQLAFSIFVNIQMGIH